MGLVLNIVVEMVAKQALRIILRRTEQEVKALTLGAGCTLPII